MRQNYNWQRYWCPRGGSTWLSESGYLYNPGPYNPQIVRFSQIATTPCLALLGEPGIGKSRTVEAEIAALAEQLRNTSDSTFLFDLHAYRSEDRLVRALFESREFTEWRNGSHRLHLFLDSLDECLLRVDTVAGLLVEEFKKYPVERLSLRVSCRTAEWPDLLENGLEEIWGDENFKVFELVQLRREDVAHAAQAEGLNSDSFLEEVETRSVGPLAAKPVTLKFLLNLFKRHRRLPSTQAELYESGCRILCEEENKSRLSSGLRGNLSATEKMAVAGRIAVVMTLANRAAVWTANDLGEATEEDVTIHDLAGWDEEAGGRRIEVTEDAVRKTLMTGLFNLRGAHRLGWAHQTYAEYLTAWYMRHAGLEADRVMDLLTHKGDPTGKLVPQLHETAAWAAGSSPELFRKIIDVDPEVLLRSDVASADVADRERLVSELLRLFDAGGARDNWGLRARYRHLKYPTLAAQLRPYIGDSSKGFLVRRVAIDVAEECKLGELQEDLVNLALNPSEDVPTRAQAAAAVSHIGDSETKAKLKPLAINTGTADKDDELKGYALMAVWPEHMKAEDLFRVITPPSESFFGAYFLFLSGRLMEGLQTGDLPTALGWVEKLKEDGDSSTTLGRLADEIILRAWEHLYEPGVIEAFAKAALSRLRRYEDVVGSRYGFEQEQEPLKVFIQDDEKRRRVLEAILQHIGDPKEEWSLLIRSGALRISTTDVGWLIDKYSTATSPTVRQTLLRLIVNSFAHEVDPEHVSALSAVRERDESRKVELEPVFCLNLETPEAEALRRNYELMVHWSKRHAEEPPLVEPPPSERVEVLLTRFEGGDLDAWWLLNRELTLEPRSTHYGSLLEPDLTVLPGWAAADERTKGRIIDAAKRYVLEGDPGRAEWFGTNKIWEPAYAGYRALLLLHDRDHGFLETLSTEVWGKWVPIILSFPTHSGGEREAPHRALLATAYRHAPKTLIDNLLALLDKANEGGEHFSISHKYDDCWDERFGKALLSKAKDPNLKPLYMGHLLDKLLEKEIDGALEYATSLIPTPPPGEGEARERAIIAAQELMAYAPDAGWPVIWPAVKPDADFGRAVSESLEYALRASKGSLFTKLGEENIAEYYIWLSRQYPHKDDHNPVGAHFVGPRESIAQWRDALLEYLKGRGTPAAVTAIERIAEALPELDWIKFTLLEARKSALTRTWTPLTPASVMSLLVEQRAHSSQSEPAPVHPPKPLLNSILEHPLSTIVSILIGTALELSPRSSPLASVAFFIIAWVLSVRMVYVLEHVRGKPKRLRLLITAGVSSITFVALLGICWWLLSAPEDSGQAAIGPPSSVQVTQQSPTGTPTPAPQAQPSTAAPPHPSPSLQATPTQTPPALAVAPVNFDVEVSLRGGSPRRLDVLLKAAGYKGPMLLEALDIQNLPDNTTDLYWGQSNVSKRGRHILPGEGYNFPGGADARQVYLFAKANIKVGISLRSR
jgi:predicted NACHT family NTPase